MNFLKQEPLRAQLILRLILLVGGSLGLAWWNDEIVTELFFIVLGIIGIDVAATERARAAVTSPATAELAGALIKNSGDVAGFIRNLVAGLVPAGAVPFALSLVQPLVRQYASEMLTDKNRAQITARVHSTLRQHGLLKGKNIGTVTLFFGTLFLLLIAGCAPLINFASRGEATMEYAVDGVLFIPAVPVLAVVVDIQGDSLRTTDENCTTYDEGLSCLLGDLSEPYLIELSGFDVTAFATWQRTGGGFGTYALAR